MKTYYLNGKQYNGETGRIQGNNGYTRTKDDGILCALINKSLWDSNGKPNILFDENGNMDIVPTETYQFIN